MANNREIRRRIKSVKNTAQITKAMQMVASTKMRRAQLRAQAGRPYSSLLTEIARHLHGQAGSETTHPLLTKRRVKHRAVLVISTDRGLCGSLNTNLFREVALNDSPERQYITVGRKARVIVPRLKKSAWRPNLLADFELKENFTFRDSKRISQFLLDKFKSGEIDAIEVAYSKFINALIQRPVIVPLVPIGVERIVFPIREKPKLENDYLYEPGPEDLLDTLLPHLIHFEVYQFILESRASEHSARMVAMKNATDNAKTLGKELTLQYNKVRQAAITTEILEIASGQAAMN